jgi:hypothetical protein
MKFQTPAVLSLALLTLAGVLAACQRGTSSQPPSTVARAQTTADHSPNGADHSAPAGPALVLPVKASAPVAGTGSEAFTGSLDEIKSFIGFYHSIRLSPEQERLKVEALSAMSAPCCSKYSLATCCCPCNMAKAAWGLAARLITEKGYTAEQIRLAEASWLKQVNPAGFSGDSCFTGGCTRPMRANGCGGMKEESIAF